MDITHRDYFGFYIEVGDTVLYPSTGFHGDGYHIGTVTKFNPKSVVVKAKTGRLKRLNPDSLIKPTEQQLVMRGLYKA